MKGKFFLENISFDGTSHLVELKIFPVSLVPRAAVSGSEVIQHLETKMNSGSIDHLSAIEPGDQNDHLNQNNHWLHWTSNIKNWTLNIDLQGLHWNLLEPHLWRVSKPTWLGRPMLDEASENNDYLENQHLARPTWEPGREQEEPQGEERDASWKLMLILSLKLQVVLRSLRRLSYLIFSDVCSFTIESEAIF